MNKVIVVCLCLKELHKAIVDTQLAAGASSRPAAAFAT